LDAAGARRVAGRTPAIKSSHPDHFDRSSVNCHATRLPCKNADWLTPIRICPRSGRPTPIIKAGSMPRQGEPAFLFLNNGRKLELNKKVSDSRSESRRARDSEPVPTELMPQASTKSLSPTKTCRSIHSMRIPATRSWIERSPIRSARSGGTQIIYNQSSLVFVLRRMFNLREKKVA